MKRKRAFTLIETLISSSIFGMIAVIAISIISFITWTLFTGQIESKNRTALNEVMYFITREVQSAEGVKISSNGKCLEIKEKGSSGYNLKYSIVESYPVDYLAFREKRLLDIDAANSKFTFDNNILKIDIKAVNNEVEVNQRHRTFTISITPRSYYTGEDI